MPVGKTKDVGWQIGVSRALPCTVEEAWALLTSEAGIAVWLGAGAVLEPVPGAAYTAADGTTGEVRSFRRCDRIRLTWRPPGWPHESTVQVAVSGGSRSTTVRFHKERPARPSVRETPQTLLQCHMVGNTVMTMASKQVTITVDEELLAWFEQKAAQTGSKLSPTIARAARNWMLWEDAARLAEADQRTGRNAADHAETELATQHEAEATEAGRGHAA